MTALRPWLELARISNLPTAWTNILAGWLLAGGGSDWVSVLWLLVSGSLAYTGGMVLNDAADVKFDQKFRSERPIPSGRISLVTAWAVGLLCVAGGAAMFVLQGGACPWLVTGLVVCILVYNFYHKPWAGSVFVMGSCRTFLFLVAASAVTGGLDLMADRAIVIRAIALGGYVVGLTLVARHESRPGTTGGWQKWVGLLGLSLPYGAAVWLISQSGVLPVVSQISFWVALLLLAACTLKALRLMSTPPPPNIGRAVGLLLAGIVLVDAVAVSILAPVAALCFVLSFPLLLLWQRKIAAT